MKAASLQEIKQELQTLSASELSGLVQRLARFKKENKELLTYLLFESYDINAYIGSVRKEMDDGMLDLHPRQIYLAKKTIRKVLRITNKHIRFSGSAQVEAELLIHFCGLLHRSGMDISRNPVLQNLYRNQLKKIDQALEGLHEDLQFDLRKSLAEATGGEN